MATEPISLPSERSHVFDPPDDVARLRKEQPLCRLRRASGELGWLVMSHELARAVLRDTRFGLPDLSDPEVRRSTTGDPAKDAEFWKALEPYGDWFPMKGFIAMNPPEHTRYRRLLAPYFTAARMDEYRPRVERIVAERLDAMEQAGPPVDLVSTFAAPVSLACQCALLGIPASEAQRFYRLGTDLSFAADGDLSKATKSVAEAVAGWREAWEFIRELCAQKRLDPADDVISDIASEGELTDDEVADTALVLFQGGLETTGDMLALAAFILLCHADQLELLRADPSMIKPAVEELLRYGGVFRRADRTALEDVELEGVAIKAGEKVTISLEAANRDPDKFDHSDRLDLCRSAQGHIAFSQGIHVCVGQHLARVELQVAIASLIARFPALRLAVPAEEISVYSGASFVFGVHELPVAW